MGIYFIRHDEALVRLRPAEVLLQGFDVLLAERLAMGTGFALLGRAAVADLRVNRDEGRMLMVSLGCLDRETDGFEVIAILDLERLPAEGFHAALHVLGEGEVGAALDGDVVAVVEDDELRQAQRAGQREGLGGYALHEAAVAAERVGVVVDDLIAGLVECRSEMTLCDGHADSHRHAGAERAGRSLDTDRMAVFRMARSLRAELTELFEVVERESAVAIEVQQRVEQHGSVAARQDEAVAVSPFRVFGVVLHMMAPQLIGHGSRSERQARMTGFCLLDGVCRQHADGVDASSVDAHKSSPLLFVDRYIPI